MKKEIKEIIFVVVIGCVLTFGLILSSLFVSHNTFKKGKSTTICINYANRSYEYKNIKTESENLHELLTEYDEKLALSFLVSGLGDLTTLYSIKSTDISIYKRQTYYVRVNGQYYGDDLSNILVSDNCVITIDYLTKSDSIGQEMKLADGGDGKLTYYFRVSATLYTIAAIIFLPILLYLVLALIKYKRQMKEFALLNPKTNQK